MRIAAALVVALAAAVASAGPVVIRTVPPVAGAQVRVDGAARATTAGDGTALLPNEAGGRHLFELVLADGRTVGLVRDVRADSLATSIEFSVPQPRQPVVPAPSPPESPRGASSRPGRASLLVIGTVGGALIEIDGEPVARTGPTEVSRIVEVTPGRRLVRLSAEGYVPFEKAVTAAAGIASQVRFDLQRVPQRAQNEGGVLTLSLLVVLALSVVAMLVVVVVLIRQQGGAVRKVTTRLIDRYETREQIGRGGMATIYRATDRFRREAPPVALKVMDDTHLSDLDLVRKFLREGEILQELNHSDPEAPLVQVYHYGRAANDGGRPFIAMELLDGEDLLRYLRRSGPLLLRDAAKVVAGVARALVPAHNTGVYHRDLTPDNVILTRVPRGGHLIRLIDFGVARHEYTAHGTLDGSIAGKPPYMSPEQCQGMQVDGRSDIYALGVMLFTLLTGAPPFVSRNPLEVMRMHKEEPLRFPAGVHLAAQTVLSKALAKDPSQRQQSVVELLRELTWLTTVA